jgi:protein phosphatase
MKKLRIEVSGITDVGIEKKVNEDSFFYKVVDAGTCYAGIFAVADGVGGLEKGEVASRKAISDINKWWENDFKNNFNNKEYLIQSLISTINETNLELISIARNNSIRTATTIVVLIIWNNNWLVLNVGDSRVYRINGLFSNKINQLTQDHSCMINKEIDGRIIRKNVLTECIGNRERINHYCNLDTIKRNDIFIICSDGIYKTITDRELADITKTNKDSMDRLCNSLVETAKQKGESDNISVIAVRLVD